MPLLVVAQTQLNSLRWAISPKYEEVRNFSEGKAWVQLNNDEVFPSGFIDTKGGLTKVDFTVAPMDYYCPNLWDTNIIDFENGYSIVKLENGKGQTAFACVNSEGKITFIKEDVESLTPFYQGVSILVDNKDNFYLVDSFGRIIKKYNHKYSFLCLNACENIIKNISVYDRNTRKNETIDIEGDIIKTNPITNTNSSELNNNELPPYNPWQNYGKETYKIKFNGFFIQKEYFNYEEIKSSAEIQNIQNNQSCCPKINQTRTRSYSSSERHKNISTLYNRIGIYDEEGLLRSHGYYLEIDTNNIEGNYYRAKDLNGYYWGFIKVPDNLKSREQAIRMQSLYYQLDREDKNIMWSLGQIAEDTAFLNILDEKYGFKPQNITLSSVFDLENIFSSTHFDSWSDETELIIYLRGNFTHNGFAFNNDTVEKRMPTTQLRSLLNAIPINHLLVIINAENAFEISKEQPIYLGLIEDLNRDIPIIDVVKREFDKYKFKKLLLIDSDGENKFIKSCVDFLDCKTPKQDENLIWYTEFINKTWQSPHHVAQYSLSSNDKDGRGIFYFAPIKNCP